MRSAVIILGLSLGFCDLANIPFMHKKLSPPNIGDHTDISLFSFEFLNIVDWMVSMCQPITGY